MCKTDCFFNSSATRNRTDFAIIGKSSSNSLGSGVLPSIFTVAAATLIGSNSSNNASNNHSSSATSSGKDHNNNLTKRGTSNTIASTNELNFRDYKAPIYNEQLNAHNALTFKLVKTGKLKSLFFLNQFRPNIKIRYLINRNCIK